MRRIVQFAFLFVASASLAAAQTPSTTRLIPYAGTALDAGGVPMTGPLTVTAELFEEQEGGAPLWREIQQVPVDDRGRYVIYLGAATPMPQIAFSEERARWLAISLAGRALPRVMLMAVPYALRAADADTLGGQPASTFVRSRVDGRLETGAGVVAEAPVEGSGVPNQLAKFNGPTTLGSSIITESATNRIGVGLTDPTGAGVVDSVFTIRNFDNNTGFAVLNQTQQRRFALNTLADGSWILYDGMSGTWNPGLSQRAGAIGIGTTSAAARLSVLTTASSVEAVRGESTSSTGVRGVSGNLVGVHGTGGAGGVLGTSTSGTGVSGTSTNGTGIVGSTTFGLAGEFFGGVHVNGTLTKSSGSFKIDHPLDPANKYLSHSFVESPDMLNVYNGNVTLDDRGEAWIHLPEWFEALNRDCRYQLTPIGAPGPNLYVAAKVSGNRFKIAGGTPAGEVSWQVTGIRQDAWANAHRIPVEEDKPPSARGSYFQPKEHAQK